MSEQRKATDVLLSIELKLEKLIKLLENKDLSDKILSNKLNNVLTSLSEQQRQKMPNFSAEAVDITQPTIVQVSSEKTLPLEQSPSSNGFSRTSRPETFAGDNAYLNKVTKKENSPRMPVQVPKGNHVEIVVPQAAIDLNKPTENKFPPNLHKSSGNISVIQRVVDKNGKSIFLAEVEIINKDTIESIQKLKTNGTGKWMTSLSVGQYNVILRKRDPITKEKVEVQQSINIDGSSNPLELPVMIIKQ